MDFQMGFGQAAIEDIEIDSQSRDDIPKVLLGLQHIYKTKNVRDQIFELLENKIAPEVSKNNGRPGLSLWKILVIGVLRLSLNCDYDRLKELVNQHKTIRQMLGHGDFCDDYQYNLQTIKDNVRLLTPELIEEINVIVVKEGHRLLGKKKANEPLRGRCDSFVVETNIHYPTDINLLADAVRKVIELTAKLSENHLPSEWRQYAYNVKSIKKKTRIAQQKKRVRGKTEEQKEKCQKEKVEAHRDLVEKSKFFICKSEDTLKKIKSSGVDLSEQEERLCQEIEKFKNHADRQIDQIVRRVLQGEKIEADEKVFSVFQPHTEWISKGKAGVPVEFGLKVCIVEDQHQFILNHRVMVKESDSEVAVPMVAKAKEAFPNLASCSYDRGFHSQNNQEELKKHLNVVALRRKGKRSKKIKELESSKEFKGAFHKHSAVESAINGLECHGLDKCKDSGLDSFKRYVGLAMLSRNMSRIGVILQRKEQACLARRKRQAQNEYLKLAA